MDNEELVCNSCYFCGKTCFPVNRIKPCRYFIYTEWVNRPVNCEQCWYLSQCKDPYPPRNHCQYFTDAASMARPAFLVDR